MMFEENRRGATGNRDMVAGSRRAMAAGRPIAPLASDEPQFPAGSVLFGGLLLLTALVQASFLPALGWLKVTPDFALVFLLIWSATHGAREGLLWAFGL